MNKEHVKTVVLTLLVIISCILTYKSWSYTAEFETIDTTLSPSPMASQGEDVTFGDVIRAYQVVYATEQEEIGTVDKDVIAEIGKLFNEKEVQFLNHPESINQLKADALIEGSEMLLIDYYSEIPARTFFTMLKSEIDENFVDFQFDRVFLELHDNYVVFNFFNSERTMFIPYRIDVSKDEVIQIINRNSDKFTDYSMVITNEATSNRLTAIYGPKSPGKKTVHQFIPSTISVSAMNETLFTQSNIEQKQTKDITVYEADTEIATYTSSNYQYTFMNLKGSDVNELSPYRSIEKSFIFLNGHMGLTSRYTLLEYDSDDNLVVYRPLINNYIVFSDEIMSEIYVKIGKTTITEYSRPMIQLNANIPSDLSVTLEDIEKVRYQIVLHEDYELSKVSKIIIAYDLKHNTDQSELNVVEYTPSWYILYDGEWIKYDIGEEA